MKEKNKQYLRNFGKLLLPFWVSKDSRSCRVILLLILVLTGFSVFIAKQVNTWYNDFYNTLQEYDFDGFCSQMLIFIVLATFHVFVTVTNYYMKQKLMIEWRHWLSTFYMKKWINNGVFYKMHFIDGNTDNPDQRIAEDLNEFVTLTFTLSIGILTNLAMLVTFFSVLWSLSAATTFTIGSFSLSLPDGYLCYLALGYAVVGTILTFIIGKPLIKLNYNQQRVEANFRYSLVRVRDNSESISMYRGVEEEGKYLEVKFSDVVRNFYQIMVKTVHVEFFALSYNQASVIFPFVISAPLYFAKQATLGTLMQVSSAFGRVQGALSMLIDSFSSIARWKSVVDRLVQFNQNMEKTFELKSIPAENQGNELILDNVSVTTPQGKNLILNESLKLKSGDFLLIRGPSGCGKSTLFRTIAGLWPYASGSITYPDGKFLFLSQKPYIPLGTLRAAICYPQAPINDLKLLPVLNDVGLSHLAGCLDIEENWSQILSVGEQQRVAFARALLLKPDVLFMDEASSALDENLENILYTRITRELKNSIIISVGHRSSIKSFHNLFLEWQEDLNWRLVPNEEYVEEGVYTENTGCDEEIHDDDLVKRFRNAYSYKNSPTGKPWYKRLFGRKNGED